MRGSITVFDCTVDDRKEWCVSLILSEESQVGYAGSRVWSKEFGDVEQALNKAVEAFVCWRYYGLGWTTPLGEDGWRLFG